MSRIRLNFTEHYYDRTGSEVVPQEHDIDRALFGTRSNTGAEGGLKRFEQASHIAHRRVGEKLRVRPRLLATFQE